VQLGKYNHWPYNYYWCFNYYWHRYNVGARVNS
jgi:hypothetical protein